MSSIGSVIDACARISKLFETPEAFAAAQTDLSTAQRQIARRFFALAVTAGTNASLNGLDDQERDIIQFVAPLVRANGTLPFSQVSLSSAPAVSIAIVHISAATALST